MKKSLCLLPCLLFACNKTADTVAVPPPPPAAPTAVSATLPPSADPALDAAQSLTDEKLQHFAVYRRESLAFTNAALGVAMNAGAKATAGDPTKIDQKKFEGAMAQDDRIKEIQVKNDAALQKAGLTQADVSALTRLTTEYYAKAMMVGNAKKELAAIDERTKVAKAKKKPVGIVDSSMQKTYEEQIAGFDKFKGEFATKYGEPAAKIVAAHEAEFIEINEQMLGALTAKPADKAEKRAVGKAPAKKK